MSNQLQITGGAKVRNLEGVITGSTGVLNSLPINGANGIPQLDSNGKILVSQLPNSVMEYQGTWNVATNIPYLVNGVGNAGDVYLVTGAATGGTNHNFGAGNILFYNGDQAIYDGSAWQRASGSSGTVTSVAISESSAALNITGSPITTSGTINIGFAGTSAQYVAGDGSLITFPSTINNATNLLALVRNNTGATIPAGSLVYITGGLGNHAVVSLAEANSEATSSQTFGMMQNDLANNADGYVVISGQVTDLDTSAYADGTVLYLSPTVPGGWTGTKPVAPNHMVYVGTVIYSHAIHGTIQTRIQNGYELQELHNVLITSPANGNILQYDSSTSLWKNVAGTTTNIAEGTNLYYTDARVRAALSATTPLSFNSSTGAFSISQSNTSTNGYLSSTDWNTFNNKQNALGYVPVGGSGSIGYISKFTGATTISQSGIYEGVTNYVSIGNTNTTYNLDVTGTARVTSDVLFGNTLTLTGSSFLNSVTHIKQITSMYPSTGYTTIAGSTTGLTLNTGGAYTLDLSFPTTASYTYTYPAASGTLALTSNIPTISGTAPISYSAGVISISQANTSTNGYLSSTDWNTFNNKQSALTNPVTGTGTSGYVTYWNGTATVAGSSNHYWDNTNGRLGIGLTNPQRSLEVYSATADNHLRLSGTAPSVSMGEAITGAIYQAKFGLATASGQYAAGAAAGDFVIISQTGNTIWATSGGEKMRLTPGGNLLIGTTTDSGYKLDVTGTGRFTGNVGIGSTYTAVAFNISYTSASNDAIRMINTATGGGTWYIGDAAGSGTGTGTFAIVNSNQSTIPRFKIDNTGAATFSSSVTANGGVLANGYTQGSTGQNLEIGYVSGSSLYAINAINRTTGSVGYDKPFYIDAQKILLNTGSGGNVGIGTSSPTNISGFTSLTLNNGTNGGIIDFQSNGTGLGRIINDGSTFNVLALGASAPLILGANGSEKMRITSGGNVLIGTTTDNGSKLQVNGDTYILGGGSLYSYCATGGGTGVIIQNTSNNTNATAILFRGYNGTTTGSITTYVNNTTYNTSSDYRLKEDFKDYSGLALIDSIKTYDFKWKSNGERSYGVKAHELQSVIPYAVQGIKDAINKDGNIEPQQVDYSKLVPVLIKAVQEQQAQIEELKQLINK
jgi:hypothetical protein